MEWSNRAACLSAEPELFFPIGTGDVSSHETAAAKTVCRRCEVVAECLDYALDTRQPHGVWGGLDEDERRAVAAEREAVAVG